MRRLLTLLLALLLGMTEPARAELVVTELSGFGAGGAERSYSFNGSFSQTTSATTFTYGAAPLGAEDATRLVVVAITARGAGTTSVSGVTIGGVAASKIVETSSTNDDAHIWALAVPSGTSATIAVTFSTSQSNGLVAVYSLYNLDSQTAVSSGSGTTGNAAITASAKDIIIAAATKRGTSSAAWSTVVQDAAYNPGSYFAAASAQAAGAVSSVASGLDQTAAAVWR